MIDEKLLDRLDKEHEQLIQPSEFDKEMRKLARLGLWTRKYRATIKHALDNSIEMHGGGDDQGVSSMEALACMPKERK